MEKCTWNLATPSFKVALLACAFLRRISRPLTLISLTVTVLFWAFSSGTTVLAQDPGPEEPVFEILDLEHVSVSISTQDDVNRGGEPTESPDSTIQSHWTTIMSEGGGNVPNGNGWQMFDANSASGRDYWDDLTCRSHNGSWSIWAADIGDMVDCNLYDNNMQAWMIYGPFDLSDAQDAELNFYYWNYSESGYDYFKWLASSNGSSFNGFKTSGNTGGWVSKNFDLSSYIGDSSVWIAFKFDSDPSITYEGAYVDDIVLRKVVAPQTYSLTVKTYIDVGEELINGLNVTVDGVTKSSTATFTLAAGNHTVSVPSSSSGRNFSHFWNLTAGQDVNYNGSTSYTFNMSGNHEIRAFYKRPTHFDDFTWNGSQITGTLQDDRHLPLQS